MTKPALSMVTTQTMVATPHYLATGAGLQILAKGGNAYDAAVAISAVLAVVYPHMTGLGGDAFFMMYDAEEQSIKGLNGTGRAGNKASTSYFTEKGYTEIPRRGILSTLTVPGMVDAWWQVWSERGHLSWEAVLEPAVRYAEEGCPVSSDVALWVQRDEQLLRNDAGLSKRFIPGGNPLTEGDTLFQPELAQSFRILQREGRDGFYTGSIMKEIVRAMEADGGLLEEADFMRHQSTWVNPVSTSYRGYEIYQMPPNSQGFSVLLMMNMLERYDLSQIPRTSPEFYHLAVEVIKQAIGERDRYLTDPEFSEIPMDTLLSKVFAEQLSESIQVEIPAAQSFLSQPSGQDTAYAAVVDEDGNAVSFIQSLYFDFGSSYTAGNTGIIMQNRGSYFSLDANHPNVLQPGKRTFHTLMPGMVTKDGEPYLLLGTQGGEGQPQTQLSILTGVLDYGCTVAEAIELPRWVYGRTWGESSDMLRMENRELELTAARLQQWGHEVDLLSEWDPIMGQAQAIMIDKRGLLSGAADPRGNGLACGW